VDWQWYVVAGEIPKMRNFDRSSARPKLIMPCGLPSMRLMVSKSASARVCHAFDAAVSPDAAPTPCIPSRGFRKRHAAPRPRSPPARRARPQRSPDGLCAACTARAEVHLLDLRTGAGPAGEERRN
jgi:hypothetical protein